MRTTAVLFDDDVYEQIRACSAAAGQTVSEWLNEAARRATRRQNAATYVAWESAHYRERGFDALDDATAAASLDGADW